jgi:hypothetical protein
VSRMGDARTRISNGWYRLAGRRISGWRQQHRNWLNRRAIERGRSPLPERATRGLRSSLPVYRNRVNTATGRPHRDDREIGRVSDASLARMKQRRERHPLPAARAPRSPGRSR